ncbi:esterase/lipase family protein [Ferrimonas senticii]|uniref:esterase/lipase family protein n=1 Tax=Ferrimonas senticii TaxID=394566 RepID=UPI0004032340|nr:hypothetical protein [Ferrimonas senticii]
MAKVVILHGLYMNALVMWPLANKLERLGWQPKCLSYRSMRIDTQALFAQIDQELADNQPAFLVGHSLGGVLLAHYVQQASLANGSRLVTLGSPLTSSRAAKQLQQWGLGIVLGNSASHGLTENPPLHWDSEVALGSLAGSNHLGLGTLAGVTDKHSDGTVQISETQLPGMTDHICVDVTHTSMLLSDIVATQTDHFLRSGRFAPLSP